MSDDVSNLSPDFDEAALLKLADDYEGIAQWIGRSTSKLQADTLARAVMIRRAVRAYDTLRERCLMAETREGALIAAIAELRTKPIPSFIDIASGK